MAVLQARYLRRDETGQQIEDASAMLDRVAAAIAEPCRSFGEDAELWRERFRHRLERLEFLPNSPTLMNAGLAHGQLAACFVLPIEDNLDSIFRTLGLAARIQQTGGGTGFSFSRLRSRGDVVCSTRDQLRAGFVHGTVRPFDRCDPRRRTSQGRQHGSPAR